ncbi:hypothetical protein K439DRAFT_600697 [Ramaria rubella]|nr:hypothetical protein K439DRAFT_600697 [Ramaria rubella]
MRDLYLDYHCYCCNRYLDGHNRNAERAHHLITIRCVDLREIPTRWEYVHGHVSMCPWTYVHVCTSGLDHHANDDIISYVMSVGGGRRHSA